MSNKIFKVILSNGENFSANSLPVRSGGHLAIKKI